MMIQKYAPFVFTAVSQKSNRSDSVWSYRLVFFSTAMWLSERNNPIDEVSQYYQTIPSSMWVTLLNLSGESPLADYTAVGTPPGRSLEVALWHRSFLCKMHTSYTAFHSEKQKSMRQLLDTLWHLNTNRHRKLCAKQRVFESRSASRLHGTYKLSRLSLRILLHGSPDVVTRRYAEPAWSKTRNER